MKVTIIQQDILWGSPEQNVQHLDKLLDGVQGADLYVLPEMFTTGFATQEDAVVEKEPSVALQWMKRKAAEFNAAFAGSVALDSGDGKLVNRLYFVRPDGSFVQYDKRHLFKYGGEHHRFNAGSEKKIVEYKGVRILLAVCYDLRFPVWLRNRGDYDAMLIVANRTGTDPVCEYTGGTAFIDPYGDTLEAVPDSTEGMITGIVDLKHLEDYGKKFPVLDDADDFEFKK